MGDIDRLNPEARVALQAAMANTPYLIEFQYEDASGKVTHRRVEPYELRAGVLFAHCTERDQMRQFKLERMSDVRSTGQTFLPRHPIKFPL